MTGDLVLLWSLCAAPLGFTTTRWGRRLSSRKGRIRWAGAGHAYQVSNGNPEDLGQLRECPQGWVLLASFKRLIVTIRHALGGHVLLGPTLEPPCLSKVGSEPFGERGEIHPSRVAKESILIQSLIVACFTLVPQLGEALSLGEQGGSGGV
jgi:hypothetical protein